MTYDEYIQSIIDERGQWNIPKEQYKEGHHIVPVCLGGDGFSGSKHKNIIWLYPKEHYIAHKLLLEKYPDNYKITLAFSMMAFPKGKTKRQEMLSAEEYEEARKIFSKSISGKNNPMYGKPPYNKGLPMSEEQRKLLSKALQGNGKGIKKSEATIEKMRSAARNRPSDYYSKPLLGKRAITDGSCVRYINKNEDIPEGFYFGNCLTAGKHDMSNYYSNEEMRKRHSENTSGKNNPMYGKGYKLLGENNGNYNVPCPEHVKEATRNKNSKWIYCFNGQEFLGVGSILNYLRENNYNISESGLNGLLVIGKAKKLEQKYPELVGTITRRLKYEN